MSKNQRKNSQAAALCIEAAERVGQGRLEEAVQCYRRAIGIDPDFADAHYNMGVVLLMSGNAEDAAAALRRAIAVKPDYVEAHTNLGAALETLGRTEEAIAAYQQALQINPSHARAHGNLGNALHKLNRSEDALTALEKALALEPQFPEALNNMGNVLCDLDRFDDAITSFQRALAANPDFVQAHHNLGNTLKKAGRLDDAAASLTRAIDINPDYAEAHWNLSHILFLQGRLAEGWDEHEWRWRCAEAPAQKRDFIETRLAPWPGPDAAATATGTVLVWGEQGVGDEILFAGMIPDLLKSGATVIIECDRRLVPLLQRSFPETTCIAQTDPPAAEAANAGIDYQMPSGSLGKWWRRDFAAFPSRPSYLKPDRDQQAAIRQKYQEDNSAFLIGIAWSSMNADIGGEKSLALADLGFLATIPGIRLVNLQYGDTAAELRMFEQVTGTAILDDAEIDQFADLDSFAAQIAALDLVISVSNTTAHLSGALGVKTCVMLNMVPLSCWLGGRADSHTDSPPDSPPDSPWYPSVQLFRQTTPGDWSGVLAQVEDEVRSRVG